MSSILVIEDSFHTRRSIRKILEREGYTVSEAEDGLKGLQLATTETPDCILLDLVIPDLDGLKILEGLRELKSGIPVIVITAHIQKAIRQRCLDLGAAAFINKPPNEDELTYAVRKVLGVNKKL